MIFHTHQINPSQFNYLNETDMKNNLNKWCEVEMEMYHLEHGSFSSLFRLEDTNMIVDACSESATRYTIIEAKNI